MNKKKSEIVENILWAILMFIVFIFISNLLHIEDNRESKEIEKKVNTIIEERINTLKCYCEGKCNWKDISKECKIEKKYETLKKEYIKAEIKRDKKKINEIEERMDDISFECFLYIAFAIKEERKNQENKSE